MKDAERVELAQVRQVWSQEADSCAPAGWQELALETHDAGGGHYLTIRTKRWAIDADEIEALAARLRAILALHADASPEKRSSTSTPTPQGSET